MALIKISNMILLLGLWRLKLGFHTGAGARPARDVWPDAAVDRLQPRTLGRAAPVVGQGDVVLSQVRPRAKRFRCVRSASKHMDLHNQN